MKRSRLVRTVVPLTAVVVAAGAGAWALRPAGATGPSASTGPLHLGADHVATAAYSTFDSCPALLDYLKAQARPLVGPYGIQGAAVPYGPMMAVPAAEGDVRAAAAAPSNAGSTSQTGTNVQVAGIDEADVTKRSGDLVLTVAGARDGLTVLRTAGSSAEVTGRLATDFHPDGLLVSGTTVLVIGSAPSGAVRSQPSGPRSATPDFILSPIMTTSTQVAEVDVADPAHPRLVRTLTLDGSSAGARLSGGILRLALSSSPSRLPLVQPNLGTGDSADSTALSRAQARNRSVVERSTVEQWLPRYTLTPATGSASSGSVVDCSRVGVPGQFSGLGTLTLLSFDLRTQGIARWDAAGVVANGTTLYATDTHTYVATTAWQQRVGPIRAGAASSGVAKAVVAGAARTQIHEFGTDGNRVRYLGSGEVAGTLRDQYAMDEYQSRLRVATTQGPSGGIVYPMAVPGDAATAGSPSAPEPVGTAPPSAGSPQGSPGSSPGAVPLVPVRPRPMPTVPRVTPSSSAVTVLELRDGALRQVGRVDGLGRGEQIQSVRFAGPLGYVVTFRQTDPLFTLDLSDPAHPKVAGELTMPGYSAYLHPLGGDLLLGVGRDGSEDGLTSGVLMSLFDVADPAHPRLLDRVTVPGAWSGVESDSHAFTYADGMALVPVDDGVLTVPVQATGLGTPSILRLARGSTGDAGVADPARMRTFADSDRLWTVAPTETGAMLLAVHGVSDLDLQSSLRF